MKPVCAHSFTHSLTEPFERISIVVGDEGVQFSTPCLLLYLPPVPFGLHELTQSACRWLRISLPTESTVGVVDQLAVKFHILKSCT
jgi:hypothetical protein